MICSYCKTENPDSNKICNFCEVDLTLERPKINPMLDERAANFKKHELEQLHTYDLLLVLRHLRAERTDYYRIMQAVRKAPDELKNNESYEDNNQYGQKLYRDLTARQNVVQELLIDRMGYYPQRVDNKLLQALKQRIERLERKTKPKG